MTNKRWLLFIFAALVMAGCDNSSNTIADGDTDALGESEEAADMADGDGEIFEEEPWPDFDTGILDPRVRPVEAFPYVFEDDDPVYDDASSAFLLYRAEGQTPEENVNHAWDYLQKYDVKKRSTSSAEIAYFERQRAIFDWLKAERLPEAGVGLGMVGDMMWIRNGWNDFLDPALLYAMRGEDLWLGNLETPIAESFEVPSALPSYLEFNSHPDLVRSFTQANGSPLFSALSFANNHTVDYGNQAAVETLAFLAEEGIPAAGARTAPGTRWVKMENGSITFGFYAATWGLNDPPLLETTTIDIDVVNGLAPEGERPVDLDEIREVLGEMTAEGVDFRIVYLHWGHEYEMYPSPIQLRVAREIVYAGADLLIGAHPHVAQPPEVCFVNGFEKEIDAPALAEIDARTACVISGAPGPARKALVLYSLGNFTTAMKTTLCQLGLIMRLNVSKTETGTGWSLGKASFAYNINEYPPEGTHRMLQLPDFLGADCAPEYEDGCPSELTDELAYLRNHVFNLDE